MYKVDNKIDQKTLICKKNIKNIMMCWNGMTAVSFGRGKPAPPGMLKLFYQNDFKIFHVF